MRLLRATAYNATDAAITKIAKQDSRLYVGANFSFGKDLARWEIERKVLKQHNNIWHKFLDNLLVTLLLSMKYGTSGAHFMCP